VNEFDRTTIEADRKLNGVSLHQARFRSFRSGRIGSIRSKILVQPPTDLERIKRAIELAGMVASFDAVEHVVSGCVTYALRAHALPRTHALMAL
jgi:hypothetical protein